MHSFEVSKLLQSYMVDKVILWSNNFFFSYALCPSRSGRALLFIIFTPEPRLNGIAAIRNVPLFCGRRKLGPGHFKCLCLEMTPSVLLTILARMIHLVLPNLKKAKKCHPPKCLQVGIAGYSW